MKTLLITFILIIGTYGYIPKNRIVYGQDAQEGQFPHEVSVQWGTGDKMVHICGGAIITPNWILTAAHCITELPFEGVMRIKAGITQLNSTDFQKIDVLERIKHPKYTGGATPHDIAMLKLKQPLSYNAKVKSINLPAAGVRPVGMTIMAGWGQTVPGATVADTPNNMQFTRAPAISNADCKKLLVISTGTDKDLYDTHMCTGPLNNVSMCPGDSGSPLIQNDTVIGVFSWLIHPCGVKLAPSVFSLVSVYLDFISDAMKN